MTNITSSTNENYKIWKSLLSSRGIKKNRLFLLSGERLVREFLELKPKTFQLEAEIITAELSPLTSSKKQFTLTKELFEALDEIGTHFNILAISLPEFSETDLSSKPEGLELICPLGDPQNLGAIIRSAVAFGAQKIILTETAANPYLPKAVKASAGSILHAPLFYLQKDAPIPEDTIALDLQGTALTSFRWPRNVRLFVGEEGAGLKSQSAFIRNRISIATKDVESLNAVVATSIALYEYSRQLNSI